MAKKDTEQTTKNKKQSDKQSSVKSSQHTATMEQQDKRTAQRLLISILIATVVALTLMLTLRYLINANVTYIGKIEGNDTMRVGEHQTLTLELGDVEVRDGAQISWFVENRRVYSKRYNKGEDISLDIAPMHTGNYNVRVNVGTAYTQVINVKVKRPLLTVVIPNTACYYGEQVPEVRYSIKGYIEGYGGQCPEAGFAVTDMTAQKVGNYPLHPQDKVVCDGYDVEVVSGTLSVLPLSLTIKSNAPITKTYDGTDCVGKCQLCLEGVKEGDEVYINPDSLHFVDKNVGRQKQIDMQRIMLEGEDACNYVVDIQHSEINGTITPKVLDINGMTFEHKNYDGTPQAQLDKMGTLNGVIEGDEVALGSIKAKFEDAQYGKDKTVIVSDIHLVGADKQNYVITNSFKVKADVFANYMDYLLNRPSVNTKEVG